MPAFKRHPAQGPKGKAYPGVYYIDGKDGRTYYIVYRKAGSKRRIEEKAGKAVDGWTAATANNLRSDRIRGKQLSNREIRDLEKLDEGKNTFSRIWELYKENGEGLKGRAQDESRFKLYLEGSLGHREAREIVPLDIDRLKRVTLKGKSPQTIKLTLALLRRLARYGTRKLGIPGLSFELAMPKVDNEKTERLTDAQLKKLLDVLRASPDVQISGLMMLALCSGLRKGELTKLQWRDIDFKAGLIYLRDPKGGKSVSVPMNESALNLLRNHPRQGEHVFTNRQGGPLGDFRKRVETIRTAAGLPAGFRPLHGLRHTFASTLAGKVNIYLLQKLMTHKDFKTTQRYAHLQDQDLQDASRIMDEAMNKI